MKIMTTYLPLDIFVGLVLLTAWLNIANGSLQSWMRSSAESVKLSFSSFAIIFTPVFIDFILSETRKHPSEISPLVTIPVTSFFTAVGIFIANLKMEEFKQSNERMKLAKTIVCAIEMQIEIFKNLLKGFEGGGRFESPMYDPLEGILFDSKMRELILIDGGKFSIEILRDLMIYSDQINKNKLTIFHAKEMIKAADDSEYEAEEKRNDRLIKTALSMTIEKGSVVLESIYRNVLSNEEA